MLEYHDMISIVRDRILDAVKKGMTLDQVKAARLTRDFDPRYAAASGPSSTAGFVEAVYRRPVPEEVDMKKLLAASRSP